MSDQEGQQTKKTLTLRSSTLSLPKGGGAAPSSGSGRGRSVMVEVRKRRVLRPEEAEAEAVFVTATAAEKTSASGLTNSERQARVAALQKAAEDKEKASQEELARKEEEPQELSVAQAPAEEQKPKKASQAATPAAPDEATLQAEENRIVQHRERSSRRDHWEQEQESDSKGARHSRSKRDEPRRRSSKVTIMQALEHQEERVRSLASIRRARAKAKRFEQPAEREKLTRDVILPEVITVQDLAGRMSERVADVVRVLMKMGMMVTANQTIDADTAELVAHELGHTVKRVSESDVENVFKEHEEIDVEENLLPRAPVVTIMGHVDHGKTSLLDALRHARVAEGEAGGITQHIGAYQVTTEAGQPITFVDTPGHEAFTAMRARGAKITDIVVLVVAADDGIMAQTVEAIHHAKAAEVPIVVAINKIDKPGADPQRVKNELLSHELVTEDFGGDVLAVPVSAKQKQNLDKLLEAILLQAEILDLKANPNRKAAGAVIEAKMEKGRGVVATLLVKKGTLRVGEIVVAGKAFGKIKALTNAEGKPVELAGPAVPVEALGLDTAPEAGDEFAVVENEKQAREVTEYRQRRERDLKAASERRGSLEDLLQQAGEGGKKTLPVIIKGDVHGSVEAIAGSLDKLATDEVQPKVLHSAVGGITESDITLARASGAIVLGFNVRATVGAKEMAARDQINIRYYSVIYDLVDDIKAILSGMLAPTIREQYLGTAEIRQVFSMSKVGKIGGCFVTDGIIKRGARVRLLRDNIVIHEGTLKSLKRFKDDAKEVGTNFECGMAFERYDDIKDGDVIEAFELIEEQRQL